MSTVREVLAETYGDNWESLISHVVSVSDRPETEYVGRQPGFPSYRTEYIPVIVLNHTQGRDVHGYEYAVGVSNYRVLKEQWADLEGLSDGPWSGSRDIALDLDKPAPEDLAEVLNALDNYPVLDDEEYSNVEQEMIQEHWESYGLADIRREIERRLDYADLTPAADDVISQLVWNGILEFGNGGGYPTMEDSSSCDFGTDDVVKFFTEHLGQVVKVKPGHGSLDEAELDLTESNVIAS